MDLLPQAYTYHKHSCYKTKQWIAVALDKAKDVWQAKHQETQERLWPNQLKLRCQWTASMAQIMVTVSYYLMLFLLCVTRIK
jgi:hypothetical protein